MVAQEFHETLEPLNEWLTAVEKKLANSEPIGTQAPKLEEQITQHKVRSAGEPGLFIHFMFFAICVCEIMHNCKTKFVLKIIIWFCLRFPFVHPFQFCSVSLSSFLELCLGLRR